MPYFDEPVGRVKIQTTSKNSQRYHTTKRLIRDLLSNTPNCHVRAGESREYLFTGNAWQKYAKRNRLGAGNLADWLVNSKKPVQPVLWSTNTALYLYSFWALFVLYEVQLDNKCYYYSINVIIKTRTLCFVYNNLMTLLWFTPPYPVSSHWLLTTWCSVPPIPYILIGLLTTWHCLLFS